MAQPVCVARQLHTCWDKVRYGLPRGWRRRRWWWRVSASPRSGLGGWDSLLLQASRSGVLLRLLSPPPAAMSCWSEPLHQSFVWEESSRKGPLTCWTRPFNIQAPPPHLQLNTHMCAHSAYVHVRHHECRSCFIYCIVCVCVCDFRAKLKRKHWEPEARAERHLPCSRPIRLSLSISNKQTSAFIANQGREKKQDRVAHCLS